MERIDRTLAVYVQHLLRPCAHFRLGFLELGVIDGRAFANLRGEINWQRIGQNKITVRQSLHERARAKPIRAVIGKVRFADDVQARDVAHQIVVHPQTTHRVMHRGINAHRLLVGIFSRDLLVNIEEISVALADGVLAQTRVCFLEIEVNAATALADAAAFVAHFLRAAGGNVARREIAEARVFPLEIIIALRFRNLRRFALVAGIFRHPDAAIVAQRFRHQGQLRLVFAAHRNAGGMNLRETGIREERTFFVGAISRGDVASARVRRKIKNVAVAAGRKDDGVRGMGADFSRDQVARDDAFGVPIDENQIEHFRLRKHLDRAGGNLPTKPLIRA